MPAQNSLIGEDTGYDLPRTSVPERDLTEERKAARFSKTREFATLKQHLTDRITYYQRWLPDGRPVLEIVDLSDAELGARWRAANVIITEFTAVIDAYERAAEAVKDADTQL